MYLLGFYLELCVYIYRSRWFLVFIYIVSYASHNISDFNILYSAEYREMFWVVENKILQKGIFLSYPFTHISTASSSWYSLRKNDTTLLDIHHSYYCTGDILFSLKLTH